MDFQVNERVKAVQVDKGISIRKVANQLKVNHTNLTAVLNRTRKCNAEILSQLVKEYNVNARWLLTGIGNMYEDSRDMDSLKAGVRLRDSHILRLEEIIEIREKEINRLKN